MAAIIESYSCSFVHSIYFFKNLVPSETGNKESY